MDWYILARGSFDATVRGRVRNTRREPTGIRRNAATVPRAEGADRLTVTSTRRRCPATVSVRAESKVKPLEGCICNSGQPLRSVPDYSQSEVDWNILARFRDGASLRGALKVPSDRLRIAEVLRYATVGPSDLSERRWS